MNDVPKCPFGHPGCDEFRQHYFDWIQEQMAVSGGGQKVIFDYLKQNFLLDEDEITCMGLQINDAMKGSPEDRAMAFLGAVLLGIYLVQRKEALKVN